MSVIFSAPGKRGDAILQWPVAYHWARLNDKKITLWLDAGTLKPLEKLFSAQPCVECVEFKPGIQSYHMGGQPWDFGVKTEDVVGHTVYHLGFRRFPERQITLQTALDTPCGVETTVVSEWEEPVFHVEHLDVPRPYCVVHGTFQSPSTGVPRFWYFFRHIRKDLEERYGRIIFTGSAEERARALDLYPEYTDYDDRGDFYELARLMAGASLVVGSGSSGVALAGSLRIPTIRVHDPIGDAPRQIWSNLGSHQWNEGEHELRALWPEIKEALKEPVPA